MHQNIIKQDKKQDNINIEYLIGASVQCIIIHCWFGPMCFYIVYFSNQFIVFLIKLWFLYLREQVAKNC